MSNIFWLNPSKTNVLNSFSEFSGQHAVFIKPDKISNSSVWRLYSATGDELAVTDNRNMAFILARQNNYTPHSVH